MSEPRTLRTTYHSYPAEEINAMLEFLWWEEVCHYPADRICAMGTYS
jgi:hypothetical protein